MHSPEWLRRVAIAPLASAIARALAATGGGRFPDKVVVWEYFTDARMGSDLAPLPTRAVRLRNGNTLISDQFNDQVIEVSHGKAIVASYGRINDPGFSPSTAIQMNAPYSAYVIGDYTGITPPFGF